MRGTWRKKRRETARLPVSLIVKRRPRAILPQVRTPLHSWGTTLCPFLPRHQGSVQEALGTHQGSAAHALLPALRLRHSRWQSSSSSPPSRRSPSTTYLTNEAIRPVKLASADPQPPRLCRDIRRHHLHRSGTACARRHPEPTVRHLRQQVHADDAHPPLREDIQPLSIASRSIARRVHRRPHGSNHRRRQRCTGLHDEPAPQPLYTGRVVHPRSCVPAHSQSVYELVRICSDSACNISRGRTSGTPCRTSTAKTGFSDTM